MTVRMNERLGDNAELFSRFGRKLGFDLRVSMPGIVQSVDYDVQTCTVRPALREKVLRGRGYEWVEIPDLPDVPFFVYGGREGSITVPVKAGDECLVVFADSCIDAWWTSGEVSNLTERRRHDLSDGFAIVGFHSKAKALNDYCSDGIRLSYSGAVAELKETGLTLKTDKAEVAISKDGGITVRTDAGGLAIETAGEVTIKGGSGVKIMDKNFLSHTHTNGNEGGPTGGVI